MATSAGSSSASGPMVPSPIAAKTVFAMKGASSFRAAHMLTRVAIFLSSVCVFLFIMQYVQV